jgi:signal transduction histidine kinase
LGGVAGLCGSDATISRCLLKARRRLGMSDDDELRRLRHDLRAPLTLAIGFAELLAADRPLPDEKRREYAERVLAATRELRELLDSELRG